MVLWISKSAIPTEDAIDWLFETYSWLLLESGGHDEFAQTELVCPTDEFFSVDPELDERQLAVNLFESTKKWSRMDDWPCRLTTHSNDPSSKDLMGNVPFGEGVSPEGAAGTFRIAPEDAEVVEITYAAGSAQDPLNFVATASHELAHYLSAAFATDPPGGPDNWEFATDVCAIFMGFGIFIANSAFNFSQYQDHRVQGWSVSRQGYLSEREIAYALAIFLALRRLPANLATPHLDPNPRTYLKHACKHVAKKRKSDLRRLGGSPDAQIRR